MGTVDTSHWSSLVLIWPWSVTTVHVHSHSDNTIYLSNWKIYFRSSIGIALMSSSCHSVVLIRRWINNFVGLVDDHDYVQRLKDNLTWLLPGGKSTCSLKPGSEARNPCGRTGRFYKPCKLGKPAARDTYWGHGHVSTHSCKKKEKTKYKSTCRECLSCNFLT